MANLKSFNATDNSIGTINRMYQNVQEAFANVPDKSDVVAGVVPVQSSATISSYNVNKDDGYIVVNARGGPMRIVVPVPARATQVVHVLNGYDTANSVSIVQADGGAFGGGDTSVLLIPGEAALMVCTGTTWFRFDE